MTTQEERLLKLLNRSEELKKVQEKLIQLKKEFEDKSVDLVIEITSLKNQIDSLKLEINNDAVKWFKESGSKVYKGGVKIREKEKLVYNEDTAFAWAKDHQMCLSFDKKAFETLALVQTPDFVKKEKEPIATFPKELKLEKIIENKDTETHEN